MVAELKRAVLRGSRHAFGTVQFSPLDLGNHWVSLWSQHPEE